MRIHQDKPGPEVIKHHADLLFVYLPHYLVFKTDIVISVHVPGKTAKRFLRM
jgi:hypothetical protein